MNRLLKKFLIILGLFAATIAWAAQPNVLFIAVDDLNAWVTHLGRNAQAKTPNIDRLAARGVTFSRAYAVVPACEPTRAALMSGLRPWTSGCYLNGDGWRKLIPEGTGLTAQFLKAGYHVAGAGKIYHSDTYHPSEWSEYMKRADSSPHGKGVAKMEGFLKPVSHDLKDEDLMDWQTVNWCIDRLSKKQKKPFFVACGLHKPHVPFVVPRKYYEMFPRDKIELPPFREDDLDDVPPAGIKMAKPDEDHAQIEKSGRWKDVIQSYLATVAYVDMNIGRLLDALDRSPNRDNTIIVLWGDHGWSFGEKKHWRKFALWEEPTRTPLIYVVPGVTKAGGVCDRPVDLMTIYPTLCELAGISVPKHVAGQSATALLRNPQSEWAHPAITTHGYQNHSVRTEIWRYIRYANGDEELYDERKDPYEWTNLAKKGGEFDAVKKQLAGSLPASEKLPGKGSVPTED